MAINKMSFLKIVGSVEDMHDVLKELVLSEKLHLDVENTDLYDNSFIIHEYESVMDGPPTLINKDFESLEAHYSEIERELELFGKGLGIVPSVDKNLLLNKNLSDEEVNLALSELMQRIGLRIDAINMKMSESSRLEQTKQRIGSIEDKSTDLDQIANLNYFDYEIGSLTRENRLRLRRNYENISSVVFKIGTVRDTDEDMHIIVYPKQLGEETQRLLKSLSWDKLEIPEGFSGTIQSLMELTSEKIKKLSKEIKAISQELEAKKLQDIETINTLNTYVKLEKKIISIEREIEYGGNTFVLNAWINKKDKPQIESIFKRFDGRLLIDEKKAEEMERQVTPPTQFNNNFFTQPFEMIVRLYGLPSYYEIDPTPFIAVTFCLMFGIMFGDIGQGFVYFMAGLLLSKKIKQAGQILVRLGGSSIVFGFVFGSFFGLEQAELPWLPSLIGRPLDPRNIPGILVAGVAFGICALSISYVFGIINSMREGKRDEAFLGNKGLAGYVFYLSLTVCLLSVAGIIGLPVMVSITAILLSIVAMILKEPIVSIITKKRPLIHGSLGMYFTESIFEAVETVLATLSNLISFVRVGAFALNHAGLFLAFLVMSELMPNMALRIVMLILGNVLILTLEGLIVFIQGLRLEYYEMFGKYFRGEGVPFKPLRIRN